MVKVERLSENRVKLVVTISAAEFDVALDKAFEKVVKDVKVDGFRPGKMPKSMFIKRFGYEALYNEAIDYAVNVSYYPALNEGGVYPTSEPKFDLVNPEGIKKDSPFDYTVEFDVWPNVHLGEYKGLKVKKQTVRITKKDVQAYIDSELSKKAENVIKEGPAELGDTVVIDFEGFVDGVAFEGGKSENYSLVLGSNSFIPGFEDQLVGSKTDDNVEVNVKFPENYHAELANKDATFKCVVHEVKTKVIPTLDDEFVKGLEIENVDTVALYEEHVKTLLKDKKTKENEDKFTNDCINMVCENSYADFPQSLINSGVDNSVKRLEAQAKQYGIPVETLLQYMGGTNLEDFKKEAEKNVRKQYLEELVFDEIAKLENITATTEEIEAKFLEIAGEESKVEQVKKQYSPSAVAFQIKVDKALKLIKDSVVKEK